MTAGKASPVRRCMDFDGGCIQPFRGRFSGAHEEAVTTIPAASIAFERQGVTNDCAVAGSTGSLLQGFSRRVK